MEHIHVKQGDEKNCFVKQNDAEKTLFAREMKNVMRN
jgi:hypothetical protein